MKSHFGTQDDLATFCSHPESHFGNQDELGTFSARSKSFKDETGDEAFPLGKIEFPHVPPRLKEDLLFSWIQKHLNSFFNLC